MKQHKIILQIIKRLKGGFQLLSALALLLFFFYLLKITTVAIENPNLSSAQLYHLQKLAILSAIFFFAFAALAIILDLIRPRVQANLSRAIQEHENRCTPEQQRILSLLGQGKTAETIAAELGKTVQEVSAEIVKILKITISE